MPEKHDLLAAILAAQRNDPSGQSLRLQWRTFAANIMALRLRNSNRRNDVRHYRPQFIRDLLDFAGPKRLAYITSVFIGYVVLTRLVRLSNASLLKKPG